MDSTSRSIFLAAVAAFAATGLEKVFGVAVIVFGIGAARILGAGLRRALLVGNGFVRPVPVFFLPALMAVFRCYKISFGESVKP